MLTLSDIPSALLIYSGEFLTDDYYIAENVDKDDKSVYGKNFDPCDRVALAAMLHNYDMLEYFLTRYPNHKNLISISIAYSGNLKALQWAVTEMNCPLDVDDPRFLYNAVCGGNIAMLRWLRQQGCQFDKHSLKHAAAEYGNLQVLKWLFSQGFRWNHNCIHIQEDKESIKGELLDWYRSFACPLDEEIWNWAVIGGSIPILQWLYNHDIPWGENACTVAASKGNMTVLLWLYSNGCPLSYEKCTIVATRQGHLSILQWLYQKSSSEALESYDRFEKSIVTWQKSMSFSCL